MRPSIGWTATVLADLVEDGQISYGIVQPGRATKFGVPIVRVGDIRNGLVATDDPLRVDASIAASYGRTTLRGGELLVSLVGTVGETAVVPDQLAGWNVARAVAVLRPQRVSASWIRLCLQTRAVAHQLQSMLNTTVQATLNLGELKRLVIPIGTESEMIAILDLFGALDEKIAANTAVARTADAYLAAQFEQFLSLEQPMAVALDEIADVNDRSADPVEGGSLRYIDIAAVDPGTFVFPERSAWADAPSRARRLVRKGDSLWSTVRPNRRSHALNLSDDPELVASTGLAVLSPRTVSFAYLYEATRRREFTSYLENSAQGSAYPAVRADRFNVAPIPLLSDGLRGRFEEVAEPLRLYLWSLAEENWSLAATRDALLPYLMSRRLRVKDAEQIVSDRT